MEVGYSSVHFMVHSSPHPPPPSSVREWITCMQVCCHSRTTEAYSPCSVDARPLHIAYPIYVQPPPLQVDHPAVRSHYVHSTLSYLPHCIQQERCVCVCVSVCVCVCCVCVCVVCVLCVCCVCVCCVCVCVCVCAHVC